MFRISIKRAIPAIVTGILLLAPLQAAADVTPAAQTAAAAGIQYLANNQQANGSISGFGGESEWSVEAVTAGGQDASTFTHNGSASLLDFLKTDIPDATTPTTTVERSIIAIAAAGQDPTNFGGVNYDALLENQHTGGQIGDPTLLNDDIFGVIAIDAAHAIQLQAEAQDTLNYMLAHQAADGGFSYTTTTCAFCGSDNNDTAAAIIAMYAAQDLGLGSSNVDTALSNAQAYLLSTQQTDGGFAYDAFSPSDGSSTAWSLMALNTIGNAVSAQASSARDWLLKDQNPDGGFSYGAFGVTASDTYTTAHAVTALLGSTWLLRPAPPVLAGQPPSGGSGGGQPTTTGSPTSAQSSPTVNQQPAVVTTTSSSAPADTLAADTSTPPSTPQVQADTTTKPNSHVASTTVKTAKKGRSYTLYGVILLGLVALIWFMLESRQAGKAK